MTKLFLDEETVPETTKELQDIILYLSNRVDELEERVEQLETLRTAITEIDTFDVGFDSTDDVDWADIAGESRPKEPTYEW